MTLHNKYDKATLKKKLEAENFKRITLSFYRYVYFDQLEITRAEMYRSFEEMGILGRIYLASEGINAQLSIPEHNFDKFKSFLQSNIHLQNMPLKIAVEENKESFIKLIVRIKNKVVADGLDDLSFDVTNVGKHLNAEEFNRSMDDPKAIVIDMRNHYESEVGHFKGALLPEADTFKEALSMGLKMVEDKKDHKILLYCTGGIRCEKASAWFKHHGFDDVNQLYGGIIQYASEINQHDIPSKYIGKNFVFDNRMGERITNDVISKCHQCGAECDEHVNCANDDCHLLFIQCDQCNEDMDGCCTPRCQEIFHLPLEEQIALRKGQQKKDTLSVYRSRLRPDLRRIIADGHEQSLDKKKE